MTVCTDTEAETVLPPHERRRGQAVLIRVAAANIVMGTGLATVPLFLLTLRASPFQIGVLATLSQMGPLAQIAGLRVLPRVGKARLGIAGRFVSVIPLALLLLAAAAGGRSHAIVWIVIGAAAVRAAVIFTADTGWWPLLQDNTSGDAIGEFFAKMRIRLRVIEVLLPMAIGAWLGAHPASWQFVLPIGLATLATGFGAMYLRAVPELPVVKDEASLWERLRRALVVSSIRRYMRFCGLKTLIMTLFYPFWIVQLKNQGLPANQLVWLMSVTAVGNVCGLRWWARMVDLHGGRPALTITLVAEAVLGIAWFALPSAGVGLICWSLGFNLAWGILQGGLAMGQTRVMMDAVPRECQAEGFALGAFSEASAGMIGGLLGGTAFQRLTGHPLSLAGLDGRLVYLAAAQVCLFAAWWASTRLVTAGIREPVQDAE